MNKVLLKQIMLDNRKEVEQYKVFQRTVDVDSFPCYVMVGVRRAGKSFIMYQKIQRMLNEGKTWYDILYINFEDDRLDGFSEEDFNLILECHAELGGRRPALFLDEIQNIPGWEKFARRMADSKHNVYITGSNAKMLSRQIMTTLGGRYLAVEVYPFSFTEYLDYTKSPHSESDSLSTDSRARFMAAYDNFFHWGGLPESIGLSVKRDYLSSVFQKIYLGDICTRNGISNPSLLRLMVKKIAESVKQPLSYNRISRILSSVGGKVSVPTVSSYVQYCEDAWLLLRVRNIASAFAERESVCKYYFIDNGILNLFLIDSDTSLLENLVAVALLRKYGNDPDNERVFYYNNSGYEVDFYIPDEKLAVQVCYSMSKSQATIDREIGALKKTPSVLSCEHRLIVTYDEEMTISDKYGTIEVVPYWKWAMGLDSDNQSPQTR